MVRAATAALPAAGAFTLLATLYLSVSLVVLRPPRAPYRRWALAASVIVAVGVLTLVAPAAPRPGLRYAVAAGGVVVAVLGALSVCSTLSGEHFEGSALVLGSALVVQGALTTSTLAGKVSDT